MPRRAATCLLFLALLGFMPVTLLSSQGATRQDVRIPWQGGWLKEFNEGVAAGEIAAKLYRPVGDAPAPFVIFLHGCGGANVPLQGHWADFFNQRGVGFLLVDSLSTRGLQHDNWTPLALYETLKSSQRVPSRIELMVMPGAAHSFDNPVKPAIVLDKYRVGEHPASRDKARDRTAEWIDTVLKQ